MADSQVIANGGFGGGSRSLALGGFGPGADFFVPEPADRRVAVQGVGFSTRNLALHGLYRAAATPPPVLWPPRASSSRAPRVRRSRRDEILLIKP